MQSAKITVKEAAQVMGVNPRFLQVGLQLQRFPFGTAVKGQKRWSYYINANRFNAYMEARDMQANKPEGPDAA
jgi:hypothetical protein